MSKEHVVEDVPAAHNDRQLVKLSWSHMGNELAIVDVYGRISIYSVQFMPLINRLALTRRCTSDQEDNMGAVIGLTWLHNDKPVGTVGSVSSCDELTCRSLSFTGRCIKLQMAGALNLFRKDFWGLAISTRSLL